MVCECKQKMKVSRTIRLCDTETMRVYFCRSCEIFVTTKELSTEKLKTEYQKKLGVTDG